MTNHQTFTLGFLHPYVLTMGDACSIAWRCPFQVDKHSSAEHDAAASAEQAREALHSTEAKVSELQQELLTAQSAVGEAESARLKAEQVGTGAKMVNTICQQLLPALSPALEADCVVVGTS